jgi:predicted SpoU family rRNA methylase
MKHDSSLTRSPSLWVAQSRHLINDIVRKVARIHLHTFGENIDEELACSIEENRQHCLLVIVGQALNNRASSYEATHLVRS